jgi:gliding motility-associated-like protein
MQFSLIRKYGLTLVWVFVGLLTSAQDFSNKGREFWIPFSYHVGMNSGPTSSVSMTLYITSDVNTSYTVEAFGAAGPPIQSGNIAVGQVVTCVIPNTYFIPSSGLFSNRAVRVSAERPVVVYSYITQSAVSGATLCLPTNVLGNEYYSMNYTQVSNENNSNSYFTIIAVEDNTTVEITPSAATTNGWTAGSVNTVTLNRGQIYQVLGTVSSTPTTGLFTGVDLTGSKIRSVASGSSSCKRIAVFSGAGKIRIGASCGNANSSDNLYQQLYPAVSWGKDYLTVPSFSRPNNFYRVIKKDPATNVYVNGALIPASSFVNNRYYEFSGGVPNRVTADQPVSLSQYFTTQGCSSNPSPYDPDMIILNPVEQNISKVTLVSSNLVATQNRQHHIHVVIPNTGTAISSFRLDGNPIPTSSWVVHPQNSGYSYAYLSNVTQGNHTISSDSGFNAMAYGYANAESYGYSAGANVKDLYQFLTIDNPNATVNVPITCVATPYYFSMTFPYQPTSITWDFGTALNTQGFANVSLTNPTPTSTTVVNGRLLYVYRLPTQYTLLSTGIYPIKILATNPTPDGCGGEQEINYDLEVLARPTANFTFSGSCLNSPTQFTGTPNTGIRPVNSVSWNFGESSVSALPNPAFTFLSAGTYSVSFSVITDIGCRSDTAIQTVTINPLPTASLSGAATTCINAPEPVITFTGGQGIAPFIFSYNINGGGTLTATTLSNTNSVTITAPTSTLGSFVYNLIRVTESGSGQCGQDQVGSVTITINSNPTATITGATSVCKDAPSPQITFLGAEGTPPYTFNYNIGGGATLSVTTLTGSSSATIDVPTSVVGSFVYNLTGVVDVNNTVCAGSPTGSVTINVNALPTATISGTTGICLNASEPLITFTGAGTSAPYTFFYAINGGSTLSVTTTGGNTATVSVSTATAGTYTYTLLSVTDGTATTCSQPQTGSAAVTVWPLPQAAYITSSPVCQAGTISFTDQSVANVGTVTGWSWNFGDPASGGQNTSTLQNPIHHFATAGTYTITLTVTTSNGCVSVNAVAPLVVHPKPRAGYIIPEVCLSDTYAQFTDTSSVASPSTIAAWSWNFGNPNASPPGNPNTSTLQSPQHSYTAVGNYNVSLIVTSSQGCKDTINQQLTVNGSFPVASFAVNNPSTLCANDSVRITNNSTVLPGNITKVEIWWDNIGAPTTVVIDDNPVFGRVYSHRYPNFQSPLTKTYQIKFRAYSGGVCMREVTQNVTVNAAPKVQFNAIPNICFDAPLFQITQATEIGNVPGSGVFSGSGVTSTGIFNPAAVGAGTYSISYLYTSTAGGCKDSLTRTIKVWERAIADFTVTSQPFCERQPITFTSTSTSTEGTLTGFVWNFANGAGVFTATSAAALTRTYATFGTYNVKLNVITSNNCVSADKIIPVEVKPLARPNFSFPAISCLPNANVQFTNLSTVPNAAPSTLTYLWDFGDPSSGTVNNSTAVDPSHVYVDLGPYNVTLSATTTDGCIHDTTIVLNTIHPQPIASFTTDAIDVCIGAPFLFTSTSNPADGTIQSYSWDLADGSTRTLGSFSYTYADTGTYIVSHFIINSFGCKSTIATKTIYVNGYPDADAGPDKQMLEGGQVQLTPPNNYPMPVTFAWTPPTYLDDPTRVDPIARPPDDITYLLTVTSNKGCSDTSSVFIKVLKDPPVPNIFSPNGDGIHDTWIIPYLDSYPGCTVEIVNRYGNLVFRSVGYATPWDGKVKGRDVPVGTYYYVIDPKNGRKKKAGYVDIIR